MVATCAYQEPRSPTSQNVVCTRRAEIVVLCIEIPAERRQDICFERPIFPSPCDSHELFQSTRLRQSNPNRSCDRQIDAQPKSLVLHGSDQSVSTDSHLPRRRCRLATWYHVGASEPAAEMMSWFSGGKFHFCLFQLFTLQSTIVHHHPNFSISRSALTVPGRHSSLGATLACCSWQLQQWPFL